MPVGVHVQALSVLLDCNLHCVLPYILYSALYTDETEKMFIDLLADNRSQLVRDL